MTRHPDRKRGLSTLRHSAEALSVIVANMKRLEMERQMRNTGSHFEEDKTQWQAEACTQNGR